MDHDHSHHNHHNHVMDTTTAAPMSHHDHHDHAAMDHSNMDHSMHAMQNGSMNHGLHHMMQMAVSWGGKFMNFMWNLIFLQFFSSTAVATRRFSSNNGQSVAAAVWFGRCWRSSSWASSTKAWNTTEKISSGNHTIPFSTARCRHRRKTVKFQMLRDRDLCSKLTENFSAFWKVLRFYGEEKAF